MIHSKTVSSRGVTTNRSGVFRDLLIFRGSLLKNASVYVIFVHAVNKVSNGAPTTHRIPGKDVKLLESTASGLSYISYVIDATSSQDQDGPQDDVKRLFDSKHVPRWTPSLIMYYPFGLVIALFRMSLWICGILLDATWFRSPAVISAYLTILGFRSQWYHTERSPTDRHVLVSNHIMPGDLMVIFQGLPQRCVHLITTEGGITNGRWGMMQFSRGFMRLLRPGEYVVPVVLRAKTPWDIRTHTLTSSFLANLFWISFCPWVEVHATVLPPLRPTVGESKAAFVRRVQSSIAEASGLVISELNISATLLHQRRLMKQS
ncbi:hypothetical protein CEUSTIGMA_g4575.t1 [Chlamydomonas eustigma]|uniref:Phospholipid/glycerol acyltransferase domain-containing protein n=1 Tax=Chlamydomonas eustigma TaxID=1157962 RepID=A0A250X2G2_9CHLO|nr:hypothetical protein CEUSTIGMA_g4575.t1 [Chlamydomonas eustigma]|eukprot:GAX77129.1 hypothetical protein CEUSTIGMA_g4575.t1 [Chlamydomonas eustigma]